VSAPPLHRWRRSSLLRLLLLGYGVVTGVDHEFGVGDQRLLLGHALCKALGLDQLDLACHCFVRAAAGPQRQELVSQVGVVHVDEDLRGRGIFPRRQSEIGDADRHRQDRKTDDHEHLPANGSEKLVQVDGVVQGVRLRMCRSVVETNLVEHQLSASWDDRAIIVWSE